MSRGDAQHLHLELSAADGAVERAVGPHHHAGAGLARGRAFNIVHADQRRGPVRRQEIPRAAARSSPAAPWRHGRPRKASQARRIASGVAGASRGTGCDGSMAWIASAKRAEDAVRQHDRRLADRLRAIDRVLRVGVADRARRGNPPARRRRPESCRWRARA